MFTFIIDVSTFTIHQSIGTGVAGTLLNSNRKIINLLWVSTSVIYVSSLWV